LAEFEASVVIDRPVEEVWKFVTDLSNASEIFPNTVDMKQTSPGPLGAGATLTHKFLKRTITGRVAEYEPNRKLVTQATSGPIKGSREIIRFESIDGKTRLTYTGHMEGSGFYKLIGPFIMGRFVREGQAESESKVNNLKRILESQSHT
jgi:carbon monoxide dehydrogenase subunit G